MGQVNESQNPAKPDETRSELDAPSLRSELSGTVTGQRETEKVDRPLFTDWASI